MIREWLRRRYVEADYRYQEATTHWWWDHKTIDRTYRRREFWARLGGRA